MREQIYLHNHSSNKLTDVSICEAESPTDQPSPDQHRINAEQSHWGKLERLLRRAAGGEKAGPAHGVPGAAPPAMGLRPRPPSTAYSPPGACRLGGEAGRNIRDSREERQTSAAQGSSQVKGGPLRRSRPGGVCPTCLPLSWPAASRKQRGDSPRVWVWGPGVSAGSLSRVQLFGTPCTAARQAPLSMGFSRQG